MEDGVPKFLTFVGGRGACEHTQSCECRIAPLLWSPGAPAQAMHTTLRVLTTHSPCTSRAAAVLTAKSGRTLCSYRAMRNVKKGSQLITSSSRHLTEGYAHLSTRELGFVAHLVAAMLVVCMVSMLMLALLRVHMVLVAFIERLMGMAMLVMPMLHMHVMVVASTGMDMLLLDALQADMHAVSSGHAYASRGYHGQAHACT